jgi:hypothetical protein
MNVCTYIDNASGGGFSSVTIPPCVPDAPVAARKRVAKRHDEFVKELEGYTTVRVTAEFFPDGRRRVEFVKELEGYPPIRVTTKFYPDGRRCVEFVKELEGYTTVRVTAEFFPDGRRCVEFVKELEGYPPTRVEAEFFPDDHEESYEKEFGEVRWYRYQLLKQDRAHALELLLQSEELLLQSEELLLQSEA